MIRSLSNSEDATDIHPKLQHIDIELTKDCNLDCNHCSSRLNTQGNELSLTRIKEILQEAKALGLKEVGLTGGEPFLRSGKLLKLIDFCEDELDAQIHIHSNGTSISNKEAIRIGQSRADITITLFGSNPKTHDSITNTEGSMKLTLEGLRRLMDAGANVCVFIVPMKSNLHEISSLIKLLYEEGIRDIRILSLSPTGRAMDRYDQLKPSDDEIILLNKELTEAQKEMNVNLSAGFCTRQSFPGLKVLKGHDRCYAAENRIHIDAFGNVFPCTASSGRIIFSAGNSQTPTYTLSEIWKASPLFQFLRRFHLNPPRKCEACARYQYCMSGCRVIMSYKYGDVSIPNPQCKGPYQRRDIRILRSKEGC